MAEAITAFAVKDAALEDFNDQFRMAWEHILFNQFHDILPGSNIPESREHALGGFEEALGCVMAASGAALRAFADQIDTSCYETPMEPLTSNSEGGGMGVNVDQQRRFRLPGTERGVGKTRLLHFFNPTGFDRDSILEATIWDWPGDAERIQAFGPEGNSLPVCAASSGVHESGHIRTDLLIKANVPALGYTTVKLIEGEKKGFCFCELPPDPRVIYYPPMILENDLVRVEFNEEDLSIKRYLNKQTGKDILGKDGGRFILYRERTVPKGGCGWVEGVHMDPKDLHSVGQVVLKSHIQKNPLRQSFEYDINYGESVIHVLVSLDSDSPVLEMSVSARWFEKADSIGTPKLSFRLTLPENPGNFLSDSQIGIENRLPEPMHDRCSRNLFHAVLPGYGPTLLTDSKYGYRGHADKLEVSLLRSSSRPDPLPEIGDRYFRIGITDCSHNHTALKEIGQRFAIKDLPYASNKAHKGTLPLEKRFLKVEGAVVTALKLSEDKTGFILRCAVQIDGTMSVCFEYVKQAFYVDLAENVLSEAKIEGSVISTPVHAGQVMSLKLCY